MSTSFVPLSISPAPAAFSEMTAPLRSDGDKTIEIGLPNGRRLTIPASLDPNILARMPNIPVSRLPELLPWNWSADGARQMAA